MPTLKLKSVDGSALRIRVKEVPQTILTGSTAVNGATNLSAEGLFAQNNNGILEFKGLQAGAGIALTPSSTGITITANVTGVTGYVTESTFTGYTASTATVIQGLDDDINYISGVTVSKLDTVVFTGYTASTAIALNNKLDTSIFNGYTASTAQVLQALDDDINYVSGQTALKLNTSIFTGYTASTASVINGKLDTSVFNGYTGTSQPILDGAITGVTAGANLSATQTGRVVDIQFTGSTGGGSIQIEYRFDDGTSGTPASGYFQFDNPTDFSTVSNIILNFENANGLDLSNILSQVKTGYKIYLQNLTDATYAATYDVTGDAVVTLTGFIIIPITVMSTGIEPMFINNNKIGVIIFTDSSSDNTKLDVSVFSGYTGTSQPILDGAITGVTVGTNLAVSQTGRVVDIQFTGSTGGGAYLPLSGGTVSGMTNFTSGVNVYGDIVPITGATTLDTSHLGKTIEANGTFTITFPNGLVTGGKINVINVGSGTITLAATTTLQSKDSKTKLASQYGGASVYHRGSNVWLAVGDLST